MCGFGVREWGMVGVWEWGKAGTAACNDGGLAWECAEKAGVAARNDGGGFGVGNVRLWRAGIKMAGR
jgi:hypothetical protein